VAGVRPSSVEFNVLVSGRSDVRIAAVSTFRTGVAVPRARRKWFWRCTGVRTRGGDAPRARLMPWVSLPMLAWGGTSLGQETSPDLGVALDQGQGRIAKLLFDPHGNRQDALHNPPVPAPRVELASCNINRCLTWTMCTDLPLTMQELQRLGRRFGPAGTMVTRS